MRGKKVIFIFGSLLLTIGFGYLSQNNNTEKKPHYVNAAVGNADDPFARIEYEQRMLRDPATGKIPPDIHRKELQFAKSLPKVSDHPLKKGMATSVWKKRGPVNRGGRTRALAVDVRTQTPGRVTLLAGGISGGIYKSDDDGKTWTDKLAPASIHSVSCLTQDTRSGHEDTWYAGTGEAAGNSASDPNDAVFRGDGVYKSTDNGETWALLPSTSDGNVQKLNSVWRYVNNIAVNPATGSVFAAATNAVLRSRDGGKNWTTLLGDATNADMSNVQISSSGIIYCAIPSGHKDAGIRKSNDDGATWTDITPSNFPTFFGRSVIGISPSDENIVYFWVYTGTGISETQMWKYDASNSTWNDVSSMLPDNGNLTVQGGYDMALQVKPDDPDFVVFGGTNLFRSTDGFASPIPANGWIGGYTSDMANIHPDQHVLVFLKSPNTNVLYSGNDGGISRSGDITQNSVSWTTLNTGYITSQFYSLAIDPATADDHIIIGGLQDNGNYFTNSADMNTPWTELPFGGDGGFTAISNGHTDYYFETQYGELWRFILDADGKPKSSTSFATIKPLYDTNYMFVNPFILDPNDNRIIYMAAGDSVWRNSDITGIPVTGSYDGSNINWAPLSHSRINGSVTALAVSKKPANRLYVGAGFGDILRIDNAQTGDPASTDISSGKGLPKNGYVNCLYVDPANADNVFAIFSNYNIPSVFYTSDGGNTWGDVSGNLEQNPDGTGNGPSCRWVTMLHYNNTIRYYVATSTGLYSTGQLNGNATVWSLEGSDGPGNVVCPMVVSRDVDGTVAVATHGAGIYSTQVVTALADRNVGPKDFELEQNYPNPFNPLTRIRFRMAARGYVELNIYDSNGRFVKSLVHEVRAAGNNRVRFDGSHLASGVYYYKLKTAGFTRTKKMILLK